MSKQLRFTEEDLKRKGFFETAPGRWMSIGRETKEIPHDTKITLIKSKPKTGRPNLNIIPEELQDTHTLLPELNGSRITLQGLTAGLNAKGGLMKQHWQKGGKDKAGLTLRLKVLHCMSFGDGPVTIDFIRHTSMFMDEDNLASSFKKIGDSLVRAGILSDDNPKILTKLNCSQVKCRRKETYMEIIITYVSRKL